MLARMRQVGFKYIAFGVDGGNNKILDIVKKGETIEIIEQAIRYSCDLGYDVKLLFVVGTPYETREDVEDKVRIARRHPIQEVHFYNTIPYPGTELFDWVRKNSLFLKAPEEYLNDISCLTKTPVFETPELSGEDRKILSRYLSKVRRQVHKDAIVRTFGKRKIVGIIMSNVLSNSLVEKLFYQSILMRRIIDAFRYRLSQKRQCGTGV
jgi:radical SAM superfamily enzyme YgiQ (UPF0313 family)